jgi:anti-sigma regulatory factor (Ser/Thr protein kinase)
MAAPAVERQATMSPSRFTTDPNDPDRESEQLALAALPNAVGTARRFVVAQLHKWGLDALADDVELVTSELVTNAVQEVGLDIVPADYAELHDARPPVIVLRLRLTVRRLLCEVWDPSPHPPATAQAALLDEGGRGMSLIAALASRWGSYPSPSGEGKVVLAWWNLTRSPQMGRPSR